MVSLQRRQSYSVYLFLTVTFRTRSLVLAPDKFSDRAKVIRHMIRVASELRKRNNYHLSHSIAAALRNCCYHGDLVYEEVSTSPEWKTLMSLHSLFADASAMKKYRLALEQTKGPAIPDLYVTRLLLAIRRRTHVISYC